MQLQHSVKPFAVVLAVGVIVSTVLPMHLAFAQVSEAEMTPILLMEENPKTPAGETHIEEPPVPMLDLEGRPEKDPSLTEAIPTKNLEEILSSESPATNAGGSETTTIPVVNGTNKAAKTAATPGKSQAHNCNISGQLNLSHNQRFLLKHWKSRFVKDNQAAFDSIRIKRNLLKRIGANPKSGREKEQVGEIKDQIRNELKMLQAKREAQIAHVLTQEQFDKWQTLRQECQPQPTPAATPGVIFNRNAEDHQIDHSLKKIPGQYY